MTRFACVVAPVLALSLSAPLSAQEALPVVEMRLAMMELQAFNIGLLGTMARGRQDYDPALAQAAADNLVRMARSDWRVYFPPGTSLDDLPDSEASPKLWQAWDDFRAKQADLVTAAEALAATAGQDVAAMRGGVMALSKACSACHTPYRVQN